MLARIFCVLVLCGGLPSTALAQSQDAIDDHVVRELACSRLPSPTPTLLALVRKGFIRVADQKGADSLSCWSLRKPWSLKGLPIAGLCAFEEDEVLRAIDPKLHWRGPGTSPGVQLALYTKTDVARTREWARRALGEGSRAKVQPDEGAVFEGLTEIRCSAWDVD